MKNVLVLILLAICLSACTPPSSPSAPPAEPKADALTERVATLEKKLEGIQKTASQSAVEIYQLQNRYQDAELDPSDPKFQRIDTDVGSFAVSVADITSFGDGVKLKIKLGNLSSADISGVTLHLTYGPRRDAEASMAWANKLKGKDADLTESLQAGSWNPVSIVLPGIDPKEFGYLSVSMGAKTIALRK